MDNIHNIKISMEKLKQYIEEEFKSFDPYDILNSKINFNKFGKCGPVLAIQVQKRLPFSIRSIVGTKKGINSKAMELFLNAYSRLYALYGREEDKKQTEYLFNWLISNDTKGYRCLPKKFPTDIHNQSQGIITFSLLQKHNSTYPDFATQILKWTKENMGDNKNSLNYRKYKFSSTEKTLYMKWSETWMFLSYVFLLTTVEEEK